MTFRKLERKETLGPYQLLARLGHGGMADVFLARVVGTDGLDGLVAIKRMLPFVSRDRAFVAMFLHEGRIASRLHHPNVCRVHELDQADDTLFLVMEYLHGLPWSEVVHAVPDRPPTTLVRFVVGVIAQACEGLHHAHTAAASDGRPRPIIHRDVSPSNLFVTNEGVVRLLDFGISKVLDESPTTASGMFKGKLPYAAPEQLRGERIDLRADLFSLAVVTWEALAGRALFDRASEYETMLAVAEAGIPPLPGDDRVIGRLDVVLRRALARDRAHRHDSAHALADDLRGAIAAYGAPMTASEVQTHVCTWLGPSLARRSRDLADLVGGGQPDETTGERTSVHRLAPATGMRLRDVAIVVGDAFAAVSTDEPATITSATDTLIDRTSPQAVEAPVRASATPSSEQTRPRAAAGANATYSGTADDAVLGHEIDVPDLVGIAPSGEQTRPRTEPPPELAPVGRPAWVATVKLSTSPWRPLRPRILLVVAILALVITGIVARWLV